MWNLKVAFIIFFSSLHLKDYWEKWQRLNKCLLATTNPLNFKFLENKLLNLKKIDAKKKYLKFKKSLLSSSDWSKLLFHK